MSSAFKTIRVVQQWLMPHCYVYQYLSLGPLLFSIPICPFLIQAMNFSIEGMRHEFRAQLASARVDNKLHSVESKSAYMPWYSLGSTEYRCECTYHTIIIPMAFFYFQSFSHKSVTDLTQTKLNHIILYTHVHLYSSYTVRLHCCLYSVSSQYY